MNLPSAARWPVICLLAVLVGGGVSAAVTQPNEPLRVAVAASARAALSEMAERFENRTGQEVVLIPGSSGKIFAQIVHGAPFDLFFAADAERPQRLVEEGLADCLVHYGLGELILWAPGYRDERDLSLQQVLGDNQLRRVAVANPRVAPYGAAAVEAFEALGLSLNDRRWVFGEDVGQVLQLVATRAAGAGFVARSQLVEVDLEGAADFWSVPPELYHELVHSAVRVVGTTHPAALDFLAFSISREGQAILRRRGFGAPTRSTGVE